LPGGTYLERNPSGKGMDRKERKGKQEGKEREGIRGMDTLETYCLTQ
jgi:hypothetical protein